MQPWNPQPFHPPFPPSISAAAAIHQPALKEERLAFTVRLVRNTG
jgi:hypothetical protein